MKVAKFFYVLLNLLVCLALLAGGYMHLTQNTEIMTTMTKLGYPRYLSSIIGSAEILAGLALLLPRMIVGLKEFAYAGVTLLLLGAVASHIIMNQKPLYPSLVLVAVIVAYFFRRKLMAGD